MTTQTLNIRDKGIVIYDAKTNEFFTGQNNWSEQLRKAQIYHSKKFVRYVIDKYPDRTLKTKYVTIQIEE